MLELDKIVNEAKATEEWEAVKMNILEVGMQQGMKILVNSVENVSANKQIGSIRN